MLGAPIVGALLNGAGEFGVVAVGVVDGASEPKRVRGLPVGLLNGTVVGTDVVSTKPLLLFISF